MVSSLDNTPYQPQKTTGVGGEGEDRLRILTAKGRGKKKIPWKEPLSSTDLTETFGFRLRDRQVLDGLAVGERRKAESGREKPPENVPSLWERSPTFAEHPFPSSGLKSQTSSAPAADPQCSQRLEDVKQTPSIPPWDILGAQLRILLPDGHRDPQGFILHVWGWLEMKPLRVTC